MEDFKGKLALAALKLIALLPWRGVQALGNAAGPALDPGVADILTQRAAEVALKQEEIGLPACLLVPDAIRSAISRLVRRVAPRLQVLGHSEIPETHTIRIGPVLQGASA